MTEPMGSVGPPGEEEKPTTGGRRIRDLRVAVIGALAVLLVWFAVANLQGVKIHFWVTSATAPLIVVIAISGVLGAVVVALVARVTRRRRDDGQP